MVNFREIGVIILFVVLFAGFIPCTQENKPTIIKNISLHENNLSTLPGLNMNTLEGPQPYHEANIINKPNYIKPDIKIKFDRRSTEGLI